MIIERHHDDWLPAGRTLTRTIEDVLGDAASRVEHIGSTSIPAMDAKPIFDLQVSVADLDKAEREFAPVLAAQGFTLSPYRFDHVPAGRDDPRELWTKRLWIRRGGPGPDVNLHVRLLGSPNERLALLFRDWFRARPQAVAAYARFKRLLAGVTPDVGTYADVKDPVVDLVIVAAEEWAERTDWRP